jgi:hypothetical protein
MLESGVPSRGSTFVRCYVECAVGAAAASEIGVQFTAEKAIDIATTVKLEATQVVAPSSTEKPTTK